MKRGSMKKPRQEGALERRLKDFAKYKADPSMTLKAKIAAKDIIGLCKNLNQNIPAGIESAS